MSIPHYTSYVVHCLKLYIKNKLSDLESLTDINDWKACDKVFDTLYPEDVELFTDIFTRYTGENRFSDIVMEVAKEKKLNDQYIWTKIKRLEKKVAIERGLYDTTCFTKT